MRKGSLKFKARKCVVSHRGDGAEAGEDEAALD